ncbi:MAG: F0F1 ATP synthase subunit epsilon [Deltaproteobacteria bacterium]
MANKIQLDIVTPMKLVVSDQVDLVTVPGSDGTFGVMANHTALLSSLKIGELRYTKDGTTVRLAVNGGFCEISNNRMSVLSESAEVSTEIDVERALRAKERAERRIQEAQTSREKIDLARAQAALARALTRLRVAGQSVH